VKQKLASLHNLTRPRIHGETIAETDRQLQHHVFVALCSDQVLAGDVVISHTGEETGQTGRLETLTVTVRQSSENTPALVDIPVSIAPLDNSPPQLVIGSHLIAEVDTPISLGPDVITALDRDTSPHQLTFFVIETPVWGRLQKRLASLNRRGSLSALQYCLTFLRV